MSWLYSQVLVEAFSVENFLDGEQSVPLSGNHIQQAYCAPDKMTAFSRLSRFGMTYKPLTESRGEELLTLYLEAFHAKTSQLQETEMDLKAKEAECGEKWRGSFTRYDHDTSSWKTHQCSLLGDLEAFSETWPQWGLMRNGECWEQTTLVQTTKDKGYGLEQKWPTPNAWDGKIGPMSKELMETGKHQVSLVTAVKHNPTRWGTPKAQDSRHALRDRGKGNLGEQVSGIHNGGKLNPLWTEWLMGWLLGWTDLRPLEMDKCHYVQQQLGTSLKED